MECRNDEVTRFCGGERGGDCFRVAHFADENHVWILSQGGSESGGEGFGVVTDLSLFSDAVAMSEDVFDGILDGDQHAGALGEDIFGHGGEGGRFSHASWTGDKDEARAGFTKIESGLAVAQTLQAGDLLGDKSKGGLNGAAAHVGIAAEASDAGDVHGKIDVPFLFEPCSL